MSELRNRVVSPSSVSSNPVHTISGKKYMLNNNCYVLLSNIICHWLFWSSLICFWDGAFILFRPHTLPNGKYEAFWSPYKLYLEVDKLYGDMNNGFVLCVATFNWIESIFNLLGLYLYKYRKQYNNIGALIILMSATTTTIKTIIYVLHDYYTPFTGHTNMIEYILLYIIPNGLWIVFPGLAVYSICYQLNQLTKPSNSY